jgi:hypothetical protein
MEPQPFCADANIGMDSMSKSKTMLSFMREETLKFDVWLSTLKRIQGTSSVVFDTKISIYLLTSTS